MTTIFVHLDSNTGTQIFDPNNTTGQAQTAFKSRYQLSQQLRNVKRVDLDSIELGITALNNIRTGSTATLSLIVSRIPIIINIPESRYLTISSLISAVNIAVNNALGYTNSYSSLSINLSQVGLHLIWTYTYVTTRPIYSNQYFSFAIQNDTPLTKNIMGFSYQNLGVTSSTTAPIYSLSPSTVLLPNTVTTPLNTPFPSETYNYTNQSNATDIKNGIYVTSVSSYSNYNGPNHFNGYYVFNGLVQDNSWQFWLPNGSNSLNIYSTTDSTTGVGYNGEWVQINLPYTLILTSYTLLPANTGSTSYPAQWGVFGSNDGISWSMIDYISHFNFTDSTTVQTFTVSQTPLGYTYFRYVIIACKTYTRYYPALQQWNCIGTYSKTTQSGTVSGTTTTIKTTLNSVAETNIFPDTYLTMYISELGNDVINANGLKCSFRIPLSGSSNFTKNSQYGQSVDILDNSKIFSTLTVGMYDQYGNDLSPISSGSGTFSSSLSFIS